VVIALAFAATAVIVFFLGIVNGKAIISRRINELAAPAVKIPAPPRTQQDSPPEAQPEENRASRDTPTKENVTRPGDKSLSPEPKAQEKTAKTEITKAPPVKEAVKTAPKVPEKSGEKAEPARPPEVKRRSKPDRTVSPERIWTVQVKSSPDKIFADRSRAQLKSKGYDAFVVEAEVNGKTWYRIHVGHLATRQEAENLRSTLESKERLSGTFPVQTTK
jgi:DedD protein